MDTDNKDLTESVKAYLERGGKITSAENGITGVNSRKQFNWNQSRYPGEAERRARKNATVRSHSS